MKKRRKLLNRIDYKKVFIPIITLLLLYATYITLNRFAFSEDETSIDNPDEATAITTNASYKDYIKPLQKTVSNSGIEVSLQNAVADNNILLLNFIIKNHNAPIKDTDINKINIPNSLKINDKEIPIPKNDTYKILSNNTVSISKKIDLNYDILPEKFNIDLNISTLFDKSGDWSFKFLMDTKNIKKKTCIDHINKTFNVNGTDFNISEVSISPISTNIKYSINSTDDTISMGFLVLDQDGNQLKFNNGNVSKKCSIDSSNPKTDLNMAYINNENIKRVSIIPIYYDTCSTNKDILTSKKISLHNFKPFELNLSQNMSIKINSCSFDKDNLVVKYTYKYKNKPIEKINDNDLFLKVNNKIITPVDYDCTYKNDSCLAIYNIGSEKEIEIGCYNTAYKTILEKESFEIIKK